MDTTPLYGMIYIFAFAFGASWGSFLNVVIYRLPNKLSVIKPNSFCPKCETPIKPYDNIPILSWLILRGRCRKCSASISWRYPGVELLMALLSLGLAYKVFDERALAAALGEANWLDLMVPYVVLFFFFAALVALFFIDLDVTELPPEITLPGIVLGIIYGFIVPDFGLFFDFVPNISGLDAILGAVIGGGVVLLIIMVYYFLTGRVGMGGGDIWMMAMVGAFLGWQGIYFVFMASSLQGILVGVGAAVLGGEKSKGLFRNEELEALEQEIAAADEDCVDAEHGEELEAVGLHGLRAEDLPRSNQKRSHSGIADAADGLATEAEAEEGVHRPVGKLAIPFGPFIALAAVEYVFWGAYLLPLITGGALGPRGMML